MGLANVLAAIDAGADRFDASLGGIGGCPYAPGATGNVCSEEIVHALELMGYDTGVDLAALIDAAKRLPALIGHDMPSQIVKAGPPARPAPRAGRLRRDPRARARAQRLNIHLLLPWSIAMKLTSNSLGALALTHARPRHRRRRARASARPIRPSRSR